MGLFNKKKGETMENDVLSQNDEVKETMDDESTKTVAEGEAKMVDEVSMKKYFCMMVDKEGEVILSKEGEPYFCTVDEGKATTFPEQWPYNVKKSARIDEKLRVELKEVPSSLSKEDKKKFKNEARAIAKERLMDLASDRIALAKEKIKIVANTENGADSVQEESLKGACEEQMPDNESLVIDDKKERDSDLKQQHDSKVPKDSNEQDERIMQSFSDKVTDIINTIEKTGSQTNQDINDAIDAIEDAIARNDQDFVSEVSRIVKESAQNADVRNKKYTEELLNALNQKTQKAEENVSRKVNDMGRNVSESQDKIVSKVNAVGKRVSDLAESVEGIEGNLTRLEQLDEITKLLTDKGLNISMEIPPINAEEEDIINLVRYSQKITEQLGYAARDLIRKREVFKSQAESNENEQKMMAHKIETARQEGISEGKKIVVKQLLSKYESIDAIKESNENYIHVIWTMLQELGVVIDGDGFYEKGNEIELSAEDIERMMATYSKIETPGKYKVTGTGLSLNGEIIAVAQFAKITEEKTLLEDQLQETVTEGNDIDGSTEEKSSEATDTAEEAYIKDNENMEQNEKSQKADC